MTFTPFPSFFPYAVKQHWTRENPLRSVEIPSDKEAVRMHIRLGVAEGTTAATRKVNGDPHGRLSIIDGT
jgi:hypothetical protein